MSQPAAAARTSDDFIPVRPEWVDSVKEDVLEPELEIVDPHHHLWDRPGDRYLLPELLADCGSGHRVTATVFVECRVMYRQDGPKALRSLGETEFVNGVAAMSASGAYGSTRACAGIVGNVDLRLGDEARAALEQHVAVAGGRFRGVRNGSAWHADGIKATSANPPPGLLRDRDFRRGFECLAGLGLSFDVWSLHTQLDDVDDLARSFPQTVIVLDHVGGPLGIGRYVGRRDEVLRDWGRSMRELAAHPNVHVKLGGLGMHTPGFDFHARPQPPSSADLAQAWRPYIETCIGAFGVRRCMFGESMGGTVCLSLATRPGAPLLSLACVSTSHRGSQIQRVSQWRERVEREGMAAWSSRMMDDRFAPGALSAAAQEWFAQVQQRTSIDSLLDAADMLVRTDLAEALPRITVPTLLLAPDSSPFLALDIPSDIHRLIAHSEVAVFPGVRHGLAFSHGAQCASLLRSFLERRMGERPGG